MIIKTLKFRKSTGFIAKPDKKLGHPDYRITSRDDIEEDWIFVTFTMKICPCAVCNHKSEDDCNENNCQCCRDPCI